MQTKNSPILIGLVVDVSGTMTKAIQNPRGPKLNRMEAFRKSLKGLAVKGKELAQKSGNEQVNSVAQIFAVGFGFGNPLSLILGRSVKAVRNLLDETDKITTVPITQIADDWERYEKRIEDLAIDMFGSSPLLEAIEEVQESMDEQGWINKFGQTKVLFLLSDGKANKGSESAIKKTIKRLEQKELIIISCYVTDDDITEPRKLYSQASPYWPDGAQLLFQCSSLIPAELKFWNYLEEHGWQFDESVRLFAQVNRSDILAEFLEFVLSPAHSTRYAEPTELFISYSHGDESYRKELEKHLAILRRQGLLNTWHDRKITAGTEWKGEIDNHLENAKVIVLLISENFLNSDYCYDVELKRALERHSEGTAIVLPIVLKPVDWEGAPFSKLQMLPTDARPVSSWRSKADAFTNVTKGIRKAIQKFQK